MRFLLSSLGTLLLLTAASPAAAQISGDGPPYEVRLGLQQLYTFDSVTSRHVNYSELRTTFDAQEDFGAAQFGLHGDARFRRGWNSITDDRVDVQRLYVEYGKAADKFHARLGRIPIQQLQGTLTDGLALGGRFAKNWNWVAFGGARPHPFTLAFDPRFLGGGAGYGYQSKTLQHEGGVSTQFFDGEPDRVFITERAFYRVGSTWSFFGDLIVDLLDGPDLTRGQIGARFRPNRVLNINASVVHNHAIIPNRWWQDWIEAERARLGFVLNDQTLPVGTRRTSARIATNVAVTRGVTPYVEGRYDHRHEDSAHGYQARLGIKLASFELGYLDVGATVRRYFEADAQIAAVQGGVNFFDGLLNVDAGGAVLRSKPNEADASILIDMNTTVWVDGGAFTDTLSGLQLMGLYQAFVDQDMVFHAMFFRVAYRLRG